MADETSADGRGNVLSMSKQRPPMDRPGLSAVLDLVTFSLLALVIDLLIVAYIASKADHFR